MDRSERKRHKERKRRLKRQRHDYIRQEKESIKRQKREIAETGKKFRKRKQKTEINFIKSFFNSLFTKSYKHSEFLPGKRKNTKRQKNYLHEESKSIKRKQREMRRKMKPMHRKIRKARIENYKKNLIRFLKNPIKIKKVRGSEKLLRQQIKQDVRRQAMRKFYRFPFEVAGGIFRFWRYRKLRVKEVVRFISDKFKFLRQVFRNEELRRNYFITSINSTALFVLSFISVFYIYQYATIFIATIFNIPAILFTYRIYWPLYTYSTLYTRLALIVIFGIGPLVSIVLAYIFYRLSIWARRRTYYLKTLFLWAAIHSANMFFGAYIVGVVTRTGFIYTSEWLFLSNILDVEEIVFLITSIVVLIIIGYYSTKHFIFSSNSAKAIEPKVRVFYFFSKVLIPWLFGNIILYLTNIPNNPIDLTLLYLTTILVIIPVFSNYNSPSMQMLKPAKSFSKLKIGWAYIIVTVIVLVVLRIVLESGISYS
ncbi:MAG: hypothetical protein K8R68_12440 [Bacteroidales bacterium]|nr:hypothetical protein [Bacteroidales bacterium]